MSKIRFSEIAAPATPPAGTTELYIDSADSLLKIKNDAGTVTTIEPTSPPVTSVFGRTGAVVAANGDYTPSQVGADASGSAAAAQAFAIQRANHTGTQLAATVSDFTAAAKAAAVADSITDAVTDVAPSQNAVFDALALKEDVSNKDTDVTLAADSDTRYPSQKAIKAYVDNLPAASGTANRVTRFDSTGDLNSIEQAVVDDDGYITYNHLVEPNGNTGSFDCLRQNLSIEPIQNSPNETWVANNIQIQFDPDVTGFDIGTGGTAARMQVYNFSHNGTSDIGEINFLQNNFNVGNGTDPIDVNGISYCYGFGSFNANVNISGPMQGYGYQPNVNASATIATSEYTNAFYDAANIGCASPSYQSFNASPNILSINNNNNYSGFSCAPTITTFTGNAGFIGMNVSPTLGTFNSNGYFHGLNVNPTITSARYAAGLNVSMDNVTVFAGVAASLVIQDLTITADQPGSGGNGVTIEYTSGATAGAEVVSNTGLAISVQIESGVSTATQVAAALNGYAFFTTNLGVTISGAGGNAQVTQAATSLTGGVDAGSKLAAYLDGNVEITGNLTFGGALSIGQLNAFASQAIVDGGGNPASIHGLISAPTVAASTTIANGDTLGINTAMLLTMGDNAVVTTSFVGVAALALPAVVSMGTGATIDQLSGGTFAISLDATATGGTIGNLDLCRSIAIPNGVTAITTLAGYKFDLPFGDPGTTTWGFYASPDCHNYFAGNLKIAGSNTVSNSSVGFEIGGTTKALRLPVLTTAERDALTALEGMVVFNTTTNALEFYDGSAWV